MHICLVTCHTLLLSVVQVGPPFQLYPPCIAVSVNDNDIDTIFFEIACTVFQPLRNRAREYIGVDVLPLWGLLFFVETDRWSIHIY